MPKKVIKPWTQTSCVRCGQRWTVWEVVENDERLEHPIEDCILYFSGKIRDLEEEIETLKANVAYRGE